MNNLLLTRKVAHILVIAALGFLASTGYASTYTEDFEAIGGFVADGNAVTDFKVGPAQFTGGLSGVARIPELYKSGNHAWMVRGGDTGTIMFDSGFLNVSFYAKVFSGADAGTTITTFDINNNILNSLILNSGDPFTRFMVSGQLGHIEIANNDSDNARFNAVDDFQVNNVPVPAAAWLFMSAMLGLFGVNRKSHKNSLALKVLGMINNS